MAACNSRSLLRYNLLRSLRSRTAASPGSGLAVVPGRVPTAGAGARPALAASDDQFQWSIAGAPQTVYVSPVIVDTGNLLLPGVMLLDDGTTAGIIQSMNFRTGAVNWTCTAGTAFNCTPTVAGSVVYAGNDDGNLYAIDLTSGSVLWSLAAGAPVETTPAYDPGSGLLLSGTQAGLFFAVDLQGRKIQWSASLIAPFADDGSYEMFTPVLLDGVVFVAATDGVERNSAVYAFDAAAGSQVWTWNPPTQASSPLAVGGGVLFCGCQDGTMRGLSTASGQQLWTYQTRLYISGQPALSNGSLYFGSMDGNFYALSNVQTPAPAGQMVGVTYAISTDVAVCRNAAVFGGFDADQTASLYFLDLSTLQDPAPLTDNLNTFLFDQSAVADNLVCSTVQSDTGVTFTVLDLSILVGASCG